MPSSFFNPKSAGTRFLTNICNLIIVNLIFMVTCIPVFTIGASVTSLYRITIAILAGDNPAILKDYWKCFKENFLKATGLELLYTALAAFFVFELYMIRVMLDEQYQWTSFIAYFFLVAIVASSFYAFPLLAWFDESFKSRGVDPPVQIRRVEGAQRKWCGKTSVFLLRETGMSGHFVGRIKGAKCPFDPQFLTWDFS